MRSLLITCVTATLVGCAVGDEAEPPEEGAAEAAGEPTAAIQDTSAVAASITALEGPEAVRYDPGANAWLIANFGPGDDDDRDADGFIERVGTGDEPERRRFMTGTEAAPLHMPRGMFIAGDTLWVADVDGVHGFHRGDGRHLAFVDFRAHEPGFLNDIAVGPDGAMYVTDTGRGRVYRAAGAGARPEIVADSIAPPPNGITWDAARGAFLLAPWGDNGVIRSLTPAGAIDSVATVPATRIDGIEVIEGGILVATQSDSSLWLIESDTPRRIVRTRGRPADIGWNPAGRLVAVPYIALDRVDVWRVPRR